VSAVAYHGAVIFAETDIPADLESVQSGQEGPLRRRHLSEGRPVTDYDQGRYNLPRDGNTDNNEFLRGQGDRERWEQHTADVQRTMGSGAASTSELPSFVPNGPMMDTSGVSAAAGDFADEIRRNPIKALVKTLIQLIVVPVVVGLVFAGFGQLSNASTQTWFLIGWGLTFGLLLLFVLSVLLGFAIGFTLNVIALPFSMWRWLIGFGVLGAGLGFALATTANETNAIAQQQAIDYGLMGLLVGFVVGLFYRTLRGLHRRTRRRRAPAGRV
jgi:hypothetical protein